MAWIHINIRDASELTYLRNLKRNRAVIDVSALPGNFTHINVFCACFPGPHKASSSQSLGKNFPIGTGLCSQYVINACSQS